MELLGADSELSDAAVKGLARERGVDVEVGSFDDALAEARRRLEGREEKGVTEQGWLFDVEG